MRKIILHHHIFKNAGSTIISDLNRDFGEGFVEFHPSGQDHGLISEVALKKLLDQNEKIQAISSHHFMGENFNDALLLNCDYKFFDFILLRHPIKRLASMYFYYRRIANPGNQIVGAAKSFSFNDFLEFLIRNYPNHVISPQVQSLSRSSFPPSGAHLDLAIKRLERAALCGTVDCYFEAMVSAEYFLKGPFPELDLSFNIKNSAESSNQYDGSLGSIEKNLDRNLFQKLLKLNEMDIRLCDLANQELYRRIEYITYYKELSLSLNIRCKSLG